MIRLDEIVWTMKNRSDIEPFLNEHFPERISTSTLPGHYKVDKGTVYVSGRKIYWKERS
jgi:hypothetical protein